MSNTQQQGRADALIDKIQKDAREEAEKVLTAAGEQAELITQEARRKARLKVHGVVESLRTREEREITHEKARYETARRQWRQSEETSALAEGLTHLEAALNDLWGEKFSREQWCHNVFSVAKERLPAEAWQLEHPAGYPKDEHAKLSGEVKSLTGAIPESTVNKHLRGGLRIFAGNACVDGSIDAILADKQNNSTRFLSILLEMREGGGN